MFLFLIRYKWHKTNKYIKAKKRKFNLMISVNVRGIPLISYMHNACFLYNRKINEKQWGSANDSLAIKLYFWTVRQLNELEIYTYYALYKVSYYFCLLHVSVHVLFIISFRIPRKKNFNRQIFVSLMNVTPQNNERYPLSKKNSDWFSA